MTADCVVLDPECAGGEGPGEAATWWTTWSRSEVGDQFRPIAGTPRLISSEPRLWADLFNVSRAVLLSLAVNRFVGAVSNVREVTEVVLFEDAEGAHIWTLLSHHDYDAETVVLEARMELEDEWTGSELDMFSLACSREEFESQLPAAFLRLYVKPRQATP